MGTRPNQIRTEIEQTREELAYDVDRLADKTAPSRVVERKWEGVKDKARDLSDKVMGAKDSVADSASDAGDKAQELASRAGDKVQAAAGTVRQTPRLVARQTRGNPVAVGLIAFGVGLLAASLLPETEAEKRAGSAVAERSEGLVERAKETGREIADELGGTARDAVRSVQDTAKEAASTTVDQAKESGRTTVGQTRQVVSN